MGQLSLYSERNGKLLEGQEIRETGQPEFQRMLRFVENTLGRRGEWRWGGQAGYCRNPGEAMVARATRVVVGMAGQNGVDSGRTILGSDLLGV